MWVSLGKLGFLGKELQSNSYFIDSNLQHCRDLGATRHLADQRFEKGDTCASSSRCRASTMQPFTSSIPISGLLSVRLGRVHCGCIWLMPSASRIFLEWLWPVLAPKPKKAQMSMALQCGVCKASNKQLTVPSACTAPAAHELAWPSEQWRGALAAQCGQRLANELLVLVVQAMVTKGIGCQFQSVKLALQGRGYACCGVHGVKFRLQSR